MTTPTDDPDWLAALVEQRVAELDDENFNALVARTRAPIVQKGNVVPGVGQSVPDPRVAERAEIAAAESAGDIAEVFRLKAQWINRLQNPHNPHNSNPKG